jgi:hypothetical protein
MHWMWRFFRNIWGSYEACKGVQIMFNETFDIAFKIPSQETGLTLMNISQCADRCLQSVTYELGSNTYMAFLFIICLATALLVFTSFRKHYPISYYDYIDYLVLFNWIICILMFAYLAFFI